MTQKKLKATNLLKTEQGLNPQQEMFCQLYACSKEFFGNGVQSYIEVYEPDQTKPNWYKSACVSASQLLSNIKVYNRINQLLSEYGLNDQNADKQLLFLIDQHADFKSKLGAIREYNKLKNRIIERVKQETEIVTINTDQMTPEQLDQYLKDKLTRK